VNSSRSDTDHLIKDHAEISDRLRQIAARPDPNGALAAEALLRETITNTKLITSFPTEAFQRFVTESSHIPILVVPGDPPDERSDVRSRISRIFREAIPGASRRAKVKRDEYSVLALAAWKKIFADGLLKDVVPTRQNWSSHSKLIRKEVLPQVIDEETYRRLMAKIEIGHTARWKTKRRKGVEARKRDRVREFVLRRMRAMMNLNEAVAQNAWGKWKSGKED
jgi:hypothetical protein